MPKQDIIDDFSDEDKVESNLEFWKHKEEPEVIGLFSRWETDNYGEHGVIKTIIDEKESELHLPNLTALNGKLKQKQVKEGDKIKIVNLGEKKAEKSGRLYIDFDVYVKSA